MEVVSIFLGVLGTLIGDGLFLDLFLFDNKSLEEPEKIDLGMTMAGALDTVAKVGVGVAWFNTLKSC
jgi:hypothetical protein